MTLGPWVQSPTFGANFWWRKYGPDHHHFGSFINTKEGRWRVFWPDAPDDGLRSSGGPIARPIVLADAMRTADEEAVRLGWVLEGHPSSTPASPESMRELLALADLLPG